MSKEIYAEFHTRLLVFPAVQKSRIWILEEIIRRDRQEQQAVSTTILFRRRNLLSANFMRLPAHSAKGF
jgi:hypothetical protein